MAVEESVLYFEGKYDSDRRFVIHNWTSEDVQSYWDSRPIFIKAGDMYECEHAIARKLTREIVDREMFKAAEVAYRSAGADKAIAEKLRERAEMALLSRELRRPYEDKTITEIKLGQENPIIARIREEERAKLQAESKSNLSNEKAVNAADALTSATTATITYTSNATTGEQTVSQVTEAAPKRGRPAKPKGEFQE